EGSMPRQYRLSTSSAYSIYDTYGQDWAKVNTAEGQSFAASSGPAHSRLHGTSFALESLDLDSFASTVVAHPAEPEAEEAILPPTPARHPSPKAPHPRPARLCDWTVDDVASWSSTTPLACE
ncbi:unnamed protein product, partial [Polarella glacialis]